MRIQLTPEASKKVVFDHPKPEGLPAGVLGQTKICTCVDNNGNLKNPVKLVRASGSPQLDDLTRAEDQDVLRVEKGDRCAEVDVHGAGLIAHDLKSTRAGRTPVQAPHQVDPHSSPAICLQATDLVGRQAAFSINRLEGGAVVAEQSPVRADPKISIGPQCQVSDRQIRQTLCRRIRSETEILRVCCIAHKQQHDPDECAQ